MEILNQKGQELVEKLKKLDELASELNVEFDEDGFMDCIAHKLMDVSDEYDGKQDIQEHVEEIYGEEGFEEMKEYLNL